MFGRSSKRRTGIETLVGIETEIHGDIQFSGGIHIDGKVRGNILATDPDFSVLSIGRDGLVEGNVNVPNIVLNGVVQGDVRAERKITLSASARVEGNLFYRALEMESGATVNGKLICQDDGQKAIGHEKPVAQSSSGPKSASNLPMTAGSKAT